MRRLSTMIFNCSQSNLSKAINIVQKAVSIKSNHPILQGILIETVDNKIKLTGNDLNIGIECIIDANVEQEGSIVITSKLFGELVRKLPASNVKFEIKDNNVVNISCEKSKYTLIGQSSLEFPALPDIEEMMTCDIESDLLRNMIRQTTFATSQDESRPILTGALIEIENSNISMVAIDGFRLAIRKALIETELNHKVVIPGKTLQEIFKIISNVDNDKKIKMAITDKHILFEVDETRLISRLLEGEFIKYAQILPKENNTEIIVDANDLLNCIERASLLARESKNCAIKFNINENVLNITSNVEVGSVNEEINIDFSGNELEIGFNPKYIIDALKVIDSEKVKLEFSTNVSPCIIKPTDNDNYIYLVLPVRIS
jgi:DNA polymerase-3 subunit beta